MTHDVLQTAVLEDLSDAVCYRRWLVSLALPYLGHDAVEIGSGTGDYAADIAAEGVRVCASEVGSDRLARLRSRFEGASLVRVIELRAPAAQNGNHSSAFAFNVLEHIEDDVGALKSFARLVRPGGRVVLFVPAFPFAMSSFDRRIGHVRRYRREHIRRVMTEAGLEVEVLHHVNAPGLVAWFIGMRLLRMTPSAGPLLRLWDRRVIPVARWLETRVRPPFGQSLFAVGRTPS
jgi:SAM-dependent methyltransferase